MNAKTPGPGGKTRGLAQRRGGAERTLGFLRASAPLRETSSSFFLFFVLVLAGVCRAGDLAVDLPDGVKATEAAALAPSTKPGEDGPAVAGTVADYAIHFNGLDAGIPYDLKITLADGRVLRGANMAWYSAEPAQPDAGPLTDDDRQQITPLVTSVTSFYNISRIIALVGDHERATVLVERIRSTAFHSDAGGEVIWRVELWYFVNDFGGWQERPQTNKVLIRKRFASKEEYQAETTSLHWLPILGGIRFGKAETTRHLTLTADAIATTQP
jgi:hypothetical protein